MIPHIKDEENEALKHYVTFPRSHSQEVAEPGFES